tara:strand:+ start:2312 stop:3277 length:966 start_codon:yes stop_codon:yes gene_type:complete
MSGKPTVVSTFAGCGGSSLGYKWAGFKELLAVEWEKNAAETFRLNFPDVPVWQKDVSEVEGAAVLDCIGLSKGELDVLDGSPPCQGFSTAGKRRVNDNRNDLSAQFIRLVNELQPRVFVMENVSGMVKGTMKGRFKEIMRELKATGYNVRCKLMNAKHYGVAQSRQRLIWIGGRDCEPVFPEPSSTILTAGEAVKGLPPDHSVMKSKAGAAIWQRCKRGEQFSKHHPKGHWFNAVKCDPNKPVPAILKQQSDTEGRLCGHFHWMSPRFLNTAELKRCSSFPDEFQFIGTYSEQCARIGNAVMPRFMEHIARTIRDKMLTNG